MPKLLQVLAAAKTRSVGLDENETHSSRTTFRRGSNDDDHEIAHLSVRDEGLLARYHIVIAFTHGAGANALQIASGPRFGHRNGTHGLARHHSRQPFFLLFGASVAEEVAAAHVVMHGEVGGGTREAGVAEFLDDDRVVPKVSASAAKFFGNLRAKQAGLAAGIPKRSLDDACILPSLEIGRDLRCSKAPHSLPELVVLFVINRAMWKHHGTPVCIDDLATAASMLDRCWNQNATL